MRQSQPRVETGAVPGTETVGRLVTKLLLLLLMLLLLIYPVSKNKTGQSNVDRFLPHDAMRKRGLCCRSVSVSVRLSVTLVHCIHTAEDVVKLPGPVALSF